MQNPEFKIAFVSLNAKSINGSFGSTKYFEVFTINDGQIVNRESREVYKVQADKELPSLIQKNSNDKSNDNSSLPKSFSLTVVDKSKEKHIKMAKTISDCSYVVARGMCANAWDSIEQFKMKPILTDVKHFEDAIKQIVDGTIVNHTDKIH